MTERPVRIRRQTEPYLHGDAYLWEVTYRQGESWVLAGTFINGRCALAYIHIEMSIWYQARREGQQKERADALLKALVGLGLGWMAPRTKGDHGG